MRLRPSLCLALGAIAIGAGLLSIPASASSIPSAPMAALNYGAVTVSTSNSYGSADGTCVWEANLPSTAQTGGSANTITVAFTGTAKSQAATGDAPLTTSIFCEITGTHSSGSAGLTSPGAQSTIAGYGNRWIGEVPQICATAGVSTVMGHTIPSKTKCIPLA